MEPIHSSNASNAANAANASNSIQSYIQRRAVIHLIGIGGVSMSALAELLLSYQVPVTGSDRQSTDITEKLIQKGAQIWYTHQAANVERADLVIRTAAVHDDNPEVIRARERGIPVWERAQAWGALMREYQTAICLAGTHGKTTSTSMMALITMEAGLDPTVMVGSQLPAIGGTLRIGSPAKQYFIAESCEYCNSFLQFAPTVAVILNVEEDHLDFFPNIHAIIDSFRRFCERTPETGLVVVNRDDPNAMQCVANLARPVRTFGLSPDADVTACDIHDKNGYYGFTVRIDGKPYATVQLSVPGRHNMLNALACCAVADFLKIPGSAVEQGLDAFQGSSRRFERTGTMPCGAAVVDDYAHHPSEIRATLTAARKMNYNRILCVFQPHTYSRTKALFPAFVDVLRQCDKVILAPIYAAREQNTIGIYSSDLAQAIPGAVALDTFDEIAAWVRKEAQPGDLVLTMGAGNINEVGRMLIVGESAR